MLWRVRGPCLPRPPECGCACVSIPLSSPASSVADSDRSAAATGRPLVLATLQAHSQIHLLNVHTGQLMDQVCKTTPRTRLNA